MLPDQDLVAAEFVKVPVMFAVPEKVTERVVASERLPPMLCVAEPKAKVKLAEVELMPTFPEVVITWLLGLENAAL